MSFTYFTEELYKEVFNDFKSPSTHFPLAYIASLYYLLTTLITDDIHAFSPYRYHWRWSNRPYHRL